MWLLCVDTGIDGLEGGQQCIRMFQDEVASAGLMLGNQSKSAEAILSAPRFSTSPAISVVRVGRCGAPTGVESLRYSRWNPVGEGQCQSLLCHRGG